MQFLDMFSIKGCHHSPETRECLSRRRHIRLHNPQKYMYSTTMKMNTIELLERSKFKVRGGEQLPGGQKVAIQKLQWWPLYLLISIQSRDG